MSAKMEMPLAGVTLSPPEQNGIDRSLLRAFGPLHRGALGIACGVVVGGLVFIATAIEILRSFSAPNLYLLSQFFWGYSVSWRGAFIGLVWGGAVGFILGYGFALVRNTAVWLWLTVIRSRAEMEENSDLLDRL